MAMIFLNEALKKGANYYLVSKLAKKQSKFIK